MGHPSWNEFRVGTDGPYPQGFVRVAGVKLPLRIVILKGGVVLPVPWDETVEKTFREWFGPFAKAKGWPQNPDHDKYEIDWRGAWWAGLKQIAEEELQTRNGVKAPVSKIEVFAR